MKRLSSLLPVALGVLMIAPPLSAQSFTDADWNTRFHANCKLPVTGGAKKSISKARINGDRKLVVRLRPGDVGGCSTDNKARNNAAFWERAELRQNGVLALGKRHEISFTVQLAQGFAGPREAFFQIHGWAKGCPAYPPLMLQMNGGRPEAHVLRGVRQGRNGKGARGQHKRHGLRGVTLGSLRNAAQRVTVSLDLRSAPGRVSLQVNGKPALAPVPVEFAACAQPHIKFGIYRPGQGRAESVAIFDDFTVTSRN